MENMFRAAILSWVVLVVGTCAAGQTNAMDKVKAGTMAHPGRVFGYVTRWIVAGDTAEITMSDNARWILAGKERVAQTAALLNLSRDRQKPLLLAVDEATRQIGMVFSTMTGVPEFYGETADGQGLQVSVPPSMRVFKLFRSRPWFDEVRAEITQASETADSHTWQQWWVAFDSETGEIVDVRPAATTSRSGGADANRPAGE